MEKNLLNWKISKVHKVADTATGGTPSRNNKDYFGGDIPWVKSGELNDGVIFQTEETITKEALENSAAKLFPKGTLLVALYGATAGKTGILGVDAASNQAICAIFPKNSEINTSFLRYFIMFERKNLLSQRYGGAQPNISQTIIRNMECRYPPLPEQVKIASLLSAVQRAIEQQERLIALTTELKKALMHKLFTEGTRGEPQKMTEIGPVPESWEVVELGKISHKPQYGFTESAKPTGNVQFLRITDIQDSSVNWNIVPFCDCPEELINKYLLSEGDILFARIGATTGKKFFVKDPPKAVFASYLIRVRVKENVSAEFISQFCDTSGYWVQINRSKGDKLKGGINASMLSRLIVPLPPSKEEQEEIAEVLSTFDMRIVQLRQRKELLQSLFRILLHQLMTAQIRVNDVDLSELNHEPCAAEQEVP